VYGTLLEVAAYTAAVDGNRAAASEFIGEAQNAATRLGRDANYRFTAFGLANVTLYQVSIAQVRPCPHSLVSAVGVRWLRSDSG